MLIQNEYRRLLTGSVVALALLLACGFFTEHRALLMGRLSYEDGPVENVTALLFGLAGLFFLVLMKKSRAEDRRIRSSLFLIAWVAFCFFVAGEEVSWGQRIFGVTTPEVVRQYNHQDELNLHNLTVAGMSMNSRRLFNFVTFAIAVVGPGVALFAWGRRLIQILRLPVMPLTYVPICLASFVYIKYYAFHGANFTNEVRELIFGLSIFLFSLHAAFRPDDAFRRHPRPAAPSFGPRWAGHRHA